MSVKCKSRLTHSYSENTPQLLDILAAEGIKATFCVIGVLLQNPKHAETMQRIYREGHTICSHTWSHPHLMSLTNEQIISEMKATEDIIAKTIGVKPRYLRPPCKAHFTILD
ncbi:chitin deacetylase [Basidiobolus ranarum]|uniref:Chitin deacetylase n=1 Tax=Basidiobolus ranarum TaxID=34480 RepID=A0ABR2VNZ9_9FUNG